MKILPVIISQAKERSNNFFIELYTLWLTTGIIRLCNCDQVITFNGNAYQPVPVQRGTIKSTVDAKVDNVELKIADTDLSKVAALIEGFDFRGHYVEIDRILYPESLSNSDYVMTVFYGYLDQPVYSNGEFTVQIKASFPNNNTPSRVTQYFCNAAFGDTECGMDKSTKSVTVDKAISTKSNIVITTDTAADYYTNGLITIGYETKYIKSDYIDSNNNHVIQTLYPFIGNLQTTATIERNCNKTPEMCAKYGNRARYSGFLAVPKEFRLG
jgi:hypothetical protein